MYEFFFSPIQDALSEKTISRYCPLKRTKRLRRFQSGFLFMKSSPNTPKVFQRAWRRSLKKINVFGDYVKDFSVYGEHANRRKRKPSSFHQTLKNSDPERTRSNRQKIISRLCPFKYFFIQHCFICRPSDVRIEPMTVATFVFPVRHTAKTKYRNFETNIPRKGITGAQSQYPHSCVCERFIYSHDRSAISAGGNIQTDPGTI